jgi:GNAT superfamily N-acetyltransferase
MYAAAILEPTPFVVRAEKPDDRRFVLSTWKRAEAECSAHTEGRHFGPLQEQMMAAVLGRASTRVIIASPEGDDDAIAGWACISDDAHPIVYYVYVRPEARRIGIAKMLLGGLTLERNDVLYTARPARVRTESGWGPSPVPIPKDWRYMPRLNFLELPR